MKEIFKRILIVAWIIVVGISITIIIDEPSSLGIAVAFPAFVLAIQFIGFGFVNPMKLFRK
ncbi:MAG: hypothetical protein QG617_809 [Campylobacterota bacterium]|nr:hypothetical protein [Campylobacterota bacterium]